MSDMGLVLSDDTWLESGPDRFLTWMAFARTNNEVEVREQAGNRHSTGLETPQAVESPVTGLIGRYIQPGL